MKKIFNKKGAGISTDYAKVEALLKKEKENIETELNKIAVPNKDIPGDWKSKFPYGSGESGTASLERQADEVEEYTTRLSLERNLEEKLSKVNAALEKIAKGTYGKCEKCGNNIPAERMEIFPEARFCVDCQE